MTPFASPVMVNTATTTNTSSTVTPAGVVPGMSAVLLTLTASALPAQFRAVSLGRFTNQSAAPWGIGVFNTADPFNDNLVFNMVSCSEIYQCLLSS